MVSRPLLAALGVVVAIAVVVGALFLVVPAGPKVEEVRIGLLTPLTGPAAAFGNDMKAMAELIAEQVNAQGGIRSLGGAKIRIITADTEGKPEVGRVQARRLITQEKVHILIGALHSGVTLPVAEEAERAGIPLINDSSSLPDLTEKGFKWFFRTWGHDGIFAKNYFEFMQYLKRKSGVNFQTLGLVAEETLFCQGVFDQWKRYNADPQLGGYKIVVEIRHPSAAADLTAEALKLKLANPDVVLMCNTPAGDAILWMQTLKRVNFMPMALLTTGGFINPDYIKAMGRDGEYVFSREGWSPDLVARKPIAAKWEELFRQKTGRPMYVYPMTTHTAMTVAIKALEKAGSVEPEKIREALRSLEVRGDEILPPWSGVKFDEKGQNIYAMNFMVQLIGGKYRIVWPEEFAVIEPVFPVPSWGPR
jgi:branched-chain amino acid transport system substrate-binding protein